MFGIGMQELLIILVVALVVLGPTRLPGVARSIGKGMRELRRASDDLRSSIMFDDDDPPRGRYTSPPPPSPVHAAPVLAPSEPEAGEPPAQIHGSLAASPMVPVAREEVVAAADEPATDVAGDEPAAEQKPEREEVVS